MSDFNNPEMPDLIIPPFQPTDSPSPQPQEQVDYADYSDFTRGVLSAIPENDRPVVAKYIKDWDGNVTRKFQEIHSQYRPYLELGDIEDIQYAKYYTSMMQNDPVQFIRELTTAMREAGMDTDNLFDPNGQPEYEDQGQQPPQDTRMYQELMARQEQYESMLGTVYQQQQAFQQSQIEAQQMAQLDRLMHDMHTRHGDFDDDWFLLQLEKGATPDQAINAYKERFGSPERKPAPRLLNGNGAVRQDQVDPSRLSDADRKAYALAILQANTQS